MNTRMRPSRPSSRLFLVATALPVSLGVLFGGCASKPSLTQTGFLSDYSRLTPASGDRMRYESPTAVRYHSLIVDPVQILIPAGRFSSEERAELARYFRRSFEDAIRSVGYKVADAPGTGVGRVRLALTDVAGSTWWKKVHPVSRAMGAGTGGASMEAEVVDSVSGEQVAAVIQAGVGNQFQLTNFSTLADVQSAIDTWARLAAGRLREIGSASGAQQQSAGL